MHSTDSVKTNVFGNSCKSTLNVKLSHQLLTVIEVLKVHFQVIQEQFFRFWHCRVHDIFQQVTKIDGPLKGDPVASVI